jgi:hypothetical protein
MSPLRAKVQFCTKSDVIMHLKPTKNTEFVTSNVARRLKHRTNDLEYVSLHLIIWVEQTWDIMWDKRMDFAKKPRTECLRK